MNGDKLDVGLSPIQTIHNEFRQHHRNRVALGAVEMATSFRSGFSQDRMRSLVLDRVGSVK
jgi:hypothetical protein